jgi:hypothetical protein
MTKADLHRLVDRLPDAAIDGIARVLERAADDHMVAVLDAAPLDDEAYTDEQRAEDAAALKEPGVPLEQVRRELLG